MRQSSTNRCKRLLLMARGEIQEDNSTKSTNHELRTSKASLGTEAAGHSYESLPDLSPYLNDDELFKYPAPAPNDITIPEHFEPPTQYENSYEYLKTVDFDALKTNLCPRRQSDSDDSDKDCLVEDSDDSVKDKDYVPSDASSSISHDEILGDITTSLVTESHSPAVQSMLPANSTIEAPSSSLQNMISVTSTIEPSPSSSQTNVSANSNTEPQPSTSQNTNTPPICENDLGFTKSGQPRKRKVAAMTLKERAEKNQDTKRSKHPVITTEDHKCKKRCPELVSAPDRESINEMFWNMTWREQKLFIAQRTTCKEPVRRRNPASQPDFKRKKSLNYSFIVMGTEMSVCKAFFLNTLGFKKDNNSAITMALKLEEDPNLDDKRGTNPKNKIDRNPIIEHIQSYNPAISHYRREHAPKRRYLPSEMSVQKLYNDFCERNGKSFSYDIYRETIKSMNISFAKLGHEECDQCESYKIHNSDQMLLRHFKCEKCKEYDKHLDRAKTSRLEYQSSESNADMKYYSADLQKVIMLPRMESIKTVIFCPRLIAFNESFVPVGQSNDPPFAVLWHEAISGRKKEDIMSTFRLFFMEVRDIKYVALWLDNCAGQNKNWCLMAYIVYLINSGELCTETITLNFFEPGHTFMSADSFHHQVELSMKKIGKIYDFKDFINAVETANSGKVKVQGIKQNEFFVFEDCTAPRKISMAKPRPYLHDIVQLKFTKGEYTLDYKTSFEGNPIRLDFIKPNLIKNGFPTPKFKDEPRGITKKRKTDIIQRLGKLMPPNRLKFWEELPINEKALNLIDEHDN